MAARRRQSGVETVGKWVVAQCKVAVVRRQVDRTVGSGREVGRPQDKNCAGARRFKLTRHLR